MDQDRLSALLERVYEAVLQASLWNAVLLELSDALGGAGLNIPWIGLDSNRADGFIGVARLDQDCAGRFLSSARHIQPATERWMEAVPNPRIGQLIVREQFWTDREYLASDMYNDVIRPQKLWHWAFAPLILKPPVFVPVGILRSSRLPLLEAQDEKLLAVVLPHLGRALDLATRLNTLETEAKTIGALLDQLPSAVFLLDATGRVFRLNAKAQSMATAGDGLTLTRGCLRARLGRESSRLQRLIATAANLGQDFESPLGGAMTITRSNRRSLVLRVAPLANRGGPFEAPNARVIVFGRDPEEKIATTPERLSQMYGLTHRQAELACLLAAGHSLDEAADRLRVSRNTVRTHLQHAFDKTGARRQSELIRLVLLAAPA